MEAGKKEMRIDWITGFLMITTAVFFDLLSLIPIVNIFVDVIAALTFGLWFILKNVPLINPRRLATALIALIIEAVPAISALPAITIGVIIIILTVIVEDKTGIEIPLSKKPIGKGSGKPPIIK